jgi:hypothetical protein
MQALDEFLTFNLHPKQKVKLRHLTVLNRLMPCESLTIYAADVSPPESDRNDHA